MANVHLGNASLQQHDDATVTSSTSRSSFSLLDNIKQSSQLSSRNRRRTPVDPRGIGARFTHKKAYSYSNGISPERTFSTVSESISTSSKNDDVIESLSKSFSLFKTTSSCSSVTRFVDVESRATRFSKGCESSSDDDSSIVSASNNSKDQSAILSQHGVADLPDLDGSGFFTNLEQEELNVGRADDILNHLASSASGSLFGSTLDALSTELSPSKPTTAVVETVFSASGDSSVDTDDNGFSLLDAIESPESSRQDEERSQFTEYTDYTDYTDFTEGDYSVLTHISQENWRDGAVWLGKVACAVGSGNCNVQDIDDERNDLTLEKDSSIKNENMSNPKRGAVNQAASYLGYNEEREIRKLKARTNRSPQGLFSSLFSCTR